RCYPTRLRNSEGMVTVECALLGVYCYYWKRQVRILFAFIGLYYKTFIHHRRAQKIWPFRKHLIREKASTIPVVDYRAFYIGDKVPGCWTGHVCKRGFTYLP